MEIMEDKIPFYQNLFHSMHKETLKEEEANERFSYHMMKYDFEVSS